MGAGYCASQMQTHLFPKFSKKYYVNATGGVSGNTFLNNHDLISKFRFFEGDRAYADSESQVQEYLDVYTTGPLTKVGLLDRLADGQDIDPEYA